MNSRDGRAKRNLTKLESTACGVIAHNDSHKKILLQSEIFYLFFVAIIDVDLQKKKKKRYLHNDLYTVPLR